MFNIKTSNFSQAGNAAADDAIKSFAAARRNSPDFGKMAQQAGAIRSKIKQEGINAAARVTRAGIQTAANVKENEINIKAKQGLAKSKRKAGALAAAGKMFATAGQFGGEKRKKREISDTSPLDSRIKSLRSGAADLRTQAEGIDVTVPQSGSSTQNTSSGETGSTNSSTVTSPSISTSTTSSGTDGSTAMRLMGDLTKDGYTPTQAAAIVGNAQHESANFTAHEEFSPNSYGTKGAGFFQWTNAGGSNRRDNFENFARQQGLDPKSYEANTRFMMHELKGGAGNHWTGGMNDGGFRQINDLNTAVTSFQNNYLRPHKDHAHTDRRLQYAQSALNQWNSQNG